MKVYINKEKQELLRMSGAITFDSMPENLKKRYKVKCEICNVFLKYSSIGRHMRKVHNDPTNDKVLCPLISESSNFCVICGIGGAIKIVPQLELLHKLGKTNKTLHRLYARRVSTGTHAHEKCVDKLYSKMMSVKSNLES